MELSIDQFREGMARVCGSVNLITTDGSAGRGGFVATAMCSVTDDPPTLLVCMNTKSAQTRTFVDNGCFCVNVMRHDSTDLASVFAGKVQDMDERYAHAEWETLRTGSPALRTSLVSCDCEIAEVQTVGTHNIFIGHIVDQRLREAGKSLLYFDRSFGRFEQA
ncbi:flavin reductase [Lentibacter algarum]|uniref:flavin reductase n=1 Tax=Lentibacter algarum TaxID=576131 RepID=UPI001C096973|nr:flavin reductase [Lentibacter algarum]MBU2983695.1 flavin reductase [Lentibacter algarum]